MAAYGKNNGKIIVGTRSQAACTRTLAAPKTINASYSSNSVRTVKWSAVTGATGYQVYYKAGDNGSWTLGATLGKVTSYQKKVMHGKYYYFKVRPIYKSDTGTTYGPFKSTAYGWLVYCDPNYVAVVSDEDKPSALYIGLGIINRGKHTMRFYSSDAWYNDRYSSYDRNLAMVDEDGRRINYVDIAPGESKAVMFEVLGSRTWYDKYGKVHAKFRYDGIYYWSSNSYY